MKLMQDALFEEIFEEIKADIERWRVLGDAFRGIGHMDTAKECYDKAFELQKEAGKYILALITAIRNLC